MTTEDTTSTQAPPPASYPPIALLRRSRSDRKVVGVAGGLGRYAGVDPLILRILFVVLALFGGSGLLLYAAGWLLIPDEGETESEGQRLLRGRTSGSTTATIVAGLVALILALVAVGSLVDTGPGLGGLGVMIAVAVVVVLLVRNGQRPGTGQPGPAGQSGQAWAPGQTGQSTPPGAPGPVYGPAPEAGSGTYGQTPGTAYSTPPPMAPADAPPAPPPPVWATAPVPPVPPRPKRPKSVLGRATVSVALIVVGLMVGWNALADGSADDFRAVAVFGAALAVVAGGLLVGAVAGRSRGLIVLGLLLSMATAASAHTDDDFGGGVGERNWTPTTAAAAERDFRLGIGDAELDLTRLPGGSDVDVDVRVGIGELRVIVPEGAEVVATGQVGVGTMQLLDQPARDGDDLQQTVRADGADADGTTITLDAHVGLGDLEVRR